MVACHVVLALALWACAWTARGADDTGPLEVRVLLDNSPAAVAADPQQLRARVVAALGEFLPAHARAGVWVAGEQLQMVLPAGPVDAAWREAAAGLQLPAPPARANLADALAGLAKLPVTQDHQPHLVVVGQGVIDVSDNTVWNRALRQSVLSETLPALAGQGVQVHTLALAEDADVELLNTLALVTSGVHRLVADADAAEAALREALAIRARTEQVAIAGQPFDVLPGTRVVHVLLSADPTAGNLRPELETPQGQRLKAGLPAPNLRWHRAPGALLLTATDPPAGTWQVHPAAGQPLAVRTLLDPAMQVGDVPVSAMAGHAQRVDLTLMAGGNRVTDPAWLEQFNWATVLAQPDGQLRRLPVKPVAVPEDGVWWIDLAGFSAPGAYRLNLRLQTPTFRLEDNRQVLVDAALGLVFSPVGNDGLLTMDLAANGLRPDTVRLVARVVQPDTRMVMVPAVRRGDRHEVALKAPVPGNEQLRPGFAVDLTIRGELADGRPFELRPDRVEIPWPFPAEPLPLALSVGHPAFPPLPGQASPVVVPKAEQPAAPANPFGAPAAPVGFGAPAAVAEAGTEGAPEPAADGASGDPMVDPVPVDASAPEAPVVPEEEPLLPPWLVVALIVANNLLVFGLGIVLFRRKPTTPPVAETLAAAIDGVAAARDALAERQVGGAGTVAPAEEGAEAGAAAEPVAEEAEVGTEAEAVAEEAEVGTQTEAEAEDAEPATEAATEAETVTEEAEAATEADAVAEEAGVTAEVDPEAGEGDATAEADAATEPDAATAEADAEAAAGTEAEAEPEPAADKPAGPARSGDSPQSGGNADQAA